MIFSCTKKVLDKIKKYKTIENSKEELGLYNWYVDLINLERKNYFLFTNSVTLFSFFVYAGTKKELQNIENIFEKKLKEEIIKQISSSDKYLKTAFPEDEIFKFTKTNSRSILGSMTDFKYHIKARVHDEDGLNRGYDIVNHSINEIPMGALKYNDPRKEMRTKLENKLK